VVRGRGVADVAGRRDSGAVLLFAVPGLLLVVLGYAVGYAVLEELIAVTGADLPASAPEVGGWITGTVLATAVAAGVVVRVRRLRRPGHGGGRDGGHQK
jgi:hypothetical protein